MTTLDCKHEQLWRAAFAWGHFVSTVETHREAPVCPAGMRARFPGQKWFPWSVHGHFGAASGCEIRQEKIHGLGMKYWNGRKIAQDI